MQIKQWLVVFLLSTLFACAGQTKKEVAEEKKDKEGAKIHVQLASGYIRRGDYDVAKKKLFKAIELDKNYVPAYTTMAVLMTMLDDPTEAENYYLQALDLDPKDPQLHNNYGTFLCNNGKLTEAYEQFNKALRNQFYLTPETAHANMGYCLMQGDKPDYKLAEKHLRIALKKNPNMSSALLAMGELGIESKRYLMARAYMQRFHAVAPMNSHSLWLQIQAEYALGDKQYFIKLSQQLLKQYPESDEAQKVMELSNK